MQAQRGEGFDLRIRRHAGFIAVAAKLAAHDLLRIERPHGAEQAQLLGAHCIRIAADRRVHRQQRHHLQQMVLHDVADRADLLVKAAAALHAEILGHGDLHAVDEIAVPDRLEERVGKAEIKQVLHRLLAQIVVDAEHRGLGKHFVQRAVERLRRGKVAAEGLFDDDPRVLGAARRSPDPAPRSRTCSEEWRDSAAGAPPRPAPAADARRSPDPRSRRRRTAAAPTASQTRRHRHRHCARGCRAPDRAACPASSRRGPCR